MIRGLGEKEIEEEEKRRSREGGSMVRWQGDRRPVSIRPGLWGRSEST